MAASDEFYTEIKTEVDSILAEFGTTYNVRAEGTFDEDELENTSGATRQVTGLVATQQEQSSGGGIGLTLNTLNTGWNATKTFIMEADANPLPGEEVQVDSKWYPLSKAVPLKPADVVVVYFLDVSR